MARPPRGGHKDGNHDEVVKGLRDFGILVKSLAGVGEGCGDILCGYRGVLTVLEIKDPESSRGTKLSQKEAEFVATWPRVYVVTSADDAIRAVVEAARPQGFIVNRTINPSGCCVCETVCTCGGMARPEGVAGGGGR